MRADQLDGICVSKCNGLLICSPSCSVLVTLWVNPISDMVALWWPLTVDFNIIFTEKVKLSVDVLGKRHH